MSILQSAITDLKLAGYSQRTVGTYAWHIKRFIQYFDKDPGAINEDDVKLYFIYLNDTKKLSPSATPPASGMTLRPFPA